MTDIEYLYAFGITLEAKGDFQGAAKFIRRALDNTPKYHMLTGELVTVPDFQDAHRRGPMNFYLWSKEREINPKFTKAE